ncbi:MAG: helix-turn-helix transcriptional regulator [Deltaproteobacteria bacterium]|nr:helix-turn-helix transcriptional regulator [Deltaproteobacteria bacterium]TRZ86833.1 MAG: XRE family transcriptional regulator [bacterium]
MNEPTNIQIINQNGHPAFVVIPYDEYVRTFRKTPRIPESGNIPNDVVWLSIDKGYTLARAWRDYLGLTQTEIASRMGISQAALSQMESGEKKLRKASLEKLAKALGVTVEQLRG